MRVLVVEDEHRIADAVRKGLEQERYAVDVAYNGAAGFDLASTEDYDVILLDLMLPGMNGLEICRQLRKDRIHTPILMLTARGQVEDKVNGLDSGADDYLAKPFSFEELLARIRALTRRPRMTMGTALLIKDLKLDPKTYAVERGGKEISLTAKEFSLLAYLMANPGRILSKEQIIAHVWDYDANILPNTVEVYIKTLRRKVGADLIHTARGFGYKMG